MLLHWIVLLATVVVLVGMVSVPVALVRFLWRAGSAKRPAQQ